MHRVAVLTIALGYRLSPPGNTSNCRLASTVMASESMYPGQRQTAYGGGVASVGFSNRLLT